MLQALAFWLFKHVLWQRKPPGNRIKKWPLGMKQQTIKQSKMIKKEDYDKPS
jgi:hypothetical protein